MEESVSYGLPGSDIRLQKKALRAMMRVREADFLSAGEADVQAAAGRIFSKIEARPEFASAHCVLVYMSIRGEVPTSAFLARWSGVKRLVIPRVAGDSLELCEYLPSMLVPGYKGILEPSEAAPAVPPSEIDFALIPGVAFAWMKSPAGLSFPNANDNSGSGNLRLYRMGRGKGFYDRLLPLLHCPKMGIGFDFRYVSSIPVDPWDFPLDM